jgi:DNA polymerase III alpha subunit
MYSELANRILWYDGKSSMDIDDIVRMILNNESIADVNCLEYDYEVEMYNKLPNCDLQVKYGNEDIKADWNIPDKYKEISLREYILDKAAAHNLNKDLEYIKKSNERIDYELRLISDMNLVGLFQCILYLIDVFIEQGIVWGVGRGSSCASYILYLMDLHCVDSIQYDIPANEFYKEVINKVHNEGE